MTEAALSIPGLLTALLLPWAVGYAAARLLIARGSQGRAAILIGLGYFLGMGLCTLLLVANNAVGLPMVFTGLAAALVLLGLLLTGLARRLAQHPMPVLPGTPRAVGPGQLLFMLALLLLLGWRYLTLLGIIMEQPLFGWDAMMNWAPKAVVWLHHGELTDFVAPPQWLLEATASGPYTLGNAAASNYPEMVPLIFYWHMLGAGTGEHPLLHLPWLLAAVNLGLVLYGFLRMRGISPPICVLACYLLLSLPYLNIHTVIAGYADLWLTVMFSVGVMALCEWERYRHRGMLVITFLAALACTQLKNPGMILGLILLLAVIRVWLSLAWRTELVMVVIAMSAIVTGFALGFSFQAPGLGTISLRPETFQIGMFGPYELGFHAESAQPVMRSLWTMAHWHLLWYALAGALLLCLVRMSAWSRPSTLSLILIAMFLFYFFVFFVSRYYEHAVWFITLNRAVLYVIPSLVFWLLTYWIPEKDHSR